MTRTVPRRCLPTAIQVLLGIVASALAPCEGRAQGDPWRAIQRAGIALKPEREVAGQWTLYRVPGGLIARAVGSGRIPGSQEWVTVARGAACAGAVGRVVTPSLTAMASRATSLGGVAAQVRDLSGPALAAVSRTNGALDRATAVATSGAAGVLRRQGGMLAVLGDVVGSSQAEARAITNQVIAHSSGVDLQELEQRLLLIVREADGLVRDASQFSGAVEQLSNPGSVASGEACQHLLPLSRAASSFGQRLDPVVQRVDAAMQVVRAAAAIAPGSPATEVQRVAERIPAAVGAIRDPLVRTSADAEHAATAFTEGASRFAQELRLGTTSVVQRVQEHHGALLGAALQLSALPALRRGDTSIDAARQSLATARSLAGTNATASLAAIDHARIIAGNAVLTRADLWARALVSQGALREDRRWFGYPSTARIYAAAAILRRNAAAGDGDAALMTIRDGMASVVHVDRQLSLVRTVAVATVALIALLVAVLLFQRGTAAGVSARAVSVVAFILALAPGTRATLAQEARARPLVMVVTSSGLHLRGAPQYNAPSLGLLPKGTRVCVLRAVDRDWFQVTRRVGKGSQRGFLARGFLADPPVVLSDAEVRAVCGGAA